MRFNLFKRGKKKAGKVSKSRKIGFGSWRLILAGLIVVGGLASMYYGNEQGNVVIIVPGFFLTFGGIMLFIFSRESAGGRVLTGKKKLAAPANTLILRPDEIEFDYQKKPLGFQRRFVNDGKWYSVLTEELGVKACELVLPDPGEDERYYDPREFPNPVEMPANKKLFEPLPNMVKTLQVGIMGIVAIGLMIGIIAMSD